MWASEGSPSCRQQIAYQRRDDIYLKPGTGRLALGEQLYADKIIIAHGFFNGCCVSNRIFLTLNRDLPLYTADDRARDAEIAGSGKEAQFPLRLVEGMRLSDYSSNCVRPRISSIR